MPRKNTACATGISPASIFMQTSFSVYPAIEPDINAAPFMLSEIAI
jgi:hypothetical protein